MGSSCTVIKKNATGAQDVLSPVRKVMYSGLPTQLEMKKTESGPYFLESALNTDKKRKKRTAKWTEMLNLHAEAVFPLEEFDSEALKRRLRKGPPQLFRWQAWTAVRNLSYRISESSYLALSQDERVAETIGKDVSRTFPQQLYFKDGRGQNVLLRVLSKFAGKHPNVEYCQGMNFLVGFMLLVSGGNEVETFYMLEDLMDKMRLSGFYTAGFPYLRQCMFVLSNLLHVRLPKVSACLERYDVGEDCWMAKWFMTLFTSVLPLQVVVRVWDHLMADGVICLFKVSIALLRLAQEELLDMDLEGLAEFFQGLATKDIHPERLLAQAGKLKFTTTHLKAIEKMYSKPVESLPLGEHNSSQDAPLPPLSRKRTLSTSLFDSGQLGQPSENLQESQIPSLPDIKPVCHFLDIEKADSGEEECNDDPVVARDVLRDLLREDDCYLSDDSLTNLPQNSHGFLM